MSLLLLRVAYIGIALLYVIIAVVYCLDTTRGHNGKNPKTIVVTEKTNTRETGNGEEQLKNQCGIENDICPATFETRNQTKAK